MNKLLPLVAGFFATNVYAAEPSLETTPDSGVPFVQENADKAMKVAYMVLGGMCPTLDPSRDAFYQGIISNEKQNGSGTTILYNGQVLRVIACDIVVENPRRRVLDYLGFLLYPPDISLEEVQRGKGGFRTTMLYDMGLDGHVNNVDNADKEDQQQYLSILDGVIAACEGKQ